MEDDLKNEIAAILEVDPAILTSDLVLATLQSWDSVNKLGMMVVIGDATGATIHPVDIERLVTVGDIEALLAARRS